MQPDYNLTKWKTTKIDMEDNQQKIQNARRQKIKMDDNQTKREFKMEDYENGR